MNGEFTSPPALWRHADSGQQGYSKVAVEGPLLAFPALPCNPPSQRAPKGSQLAILSYSKRFIFIHIPKCGGSSIETEWARLMPGDLVLRFDDAEALNQRYGVSMHSRLDQFKDSRRLGSIEQFETCALVRTPLKVVESFYKYGLRQLNSAAKSGMINVTNKAWSLDEWKQFVRDKLAAGDSANAPMFVNRIGEGAVREAMLSSSFDDYLERVGDKRWERYMRDYTQKDGKDIAVNTVLKLEEPIAIRKYFKVRYFSAFTLQHVNTSGSHERLVWSKPMRQRYNEITEGEHKAFGYAITE